MSESFGFANAVNNDAVNALSNLSESLVKVIHGTADGQFPLTGYTVAAARATFAESYNIPSDAVAFINGVQVGEDYILTSNETLEFIKEAGVKG